jgi:hypothetical protein
LGWGGGSKGEKGLVRSFLKGEMGREEEEKGFR